MIQCTSRRLLLVHGLLSRVCWWGDWEVGRSGSTDNGCCGSRGRGGALSCFRVVPCGNRGPSRGSESRKYKVESSIQFTFYHVSSKKPFKGLRPKLGCFWEKRKRKVFPDLCQAIHFYLSGSTNISLLEASPLSKRNVHYVVYPLLKSVKNF